MRLMTNWKAKAAVEAAILDDKEIEWAGHDTKRGLFFLKSGRKQICAEEHGGRVLYYGGFSRVNPNYHLGDIHGVSMASDVLEHEEIDYAKAEIVCDLARAVLKDPRPYLQKYNRREQGGLTDREMVVHHPVSGSHAAVDAYIFEHTGRKPEDFYRFSSSTRRDLRKQARAAMNGGPPMKVPGAGKAGDIVNSGS